MQVWLSRTVGFMYLVKGLRRMISHGLVEAAREADKSGEQGAWGSSRNVDRWVGSVSQAPSRRSCRRDATPLPFSSEERVDPHGMRIVRESQILYPERLSHPRTQGGVGMEGTYQSLQARW